MTTILNVHKRYCHLVANSFKNQSGFVQALDKACSTFINNNSITAKAKVSQTKALSKNCFIFRALLFHVFSSTSSNFKYVLKLNITLVSSSFFRMLRKVLSSWLGTLTYC